MPHCRWVIFALVGLLFSRASKSDPPPVANLHLATSSPSLWKREMATLPAAIRTLAAEMQGGNVTEIYRLIRNRFGPAVRDIGSGASIQQWDVAEGVLTLNSLVGPSFSPKGKPPIWLMRTTNLVKANLYNDYDMTTLPSPNQYWLGSLTLFPALRYHYTDSGQFRSERAGQQANFFMRHPDGTLLVAYPRGITPASHLEEVADGATVANLTFIAHNSHYRKTFRIISRRSSRTLVFSGDGKMLFEMAKGWQSYWK